MFGCAVWVRAGRSVGFERLLSLGDLKWRICSSEHTRDVDDGFCWSCPRTTRPVKTAMSKQGFSFQRPPDRITSEFWLTVLAFPHCTTHRVTFRQNLLCFCWGILTFLLNSAQTVLIINSCADDICPSSEISWCFPSCVPKLWCHHWYGCSWVSSFTEEPSGLHCVYTTESPPAVWFC